MTQPFHCPAAATWAKRIKGNRQRSMVWCLILLLLPVSSGFGADNVLQGVFKALGIGARQAVVRPAKPVEIEVINQFSPTLNKLLDVELYFIQKVCQPNADQAARLRKFGVGEVVTLAKLMAENQNQPGAVDPRQLLIKALDQEIEKVCSMEAAKRYREEMSERLNYKQAAAAGLMLSNMDRDLFFNTNQAQKIESELRKNWKPEWSRNLQGLMYPQYAPWPDAQLIQPYLTPEQSQLITQQNRGNIQFGWEADAGFNGWVNLSNFINQLHEVEPIAEEQK